MKIGMNLLYRYISIVFIQIFLDICYNYINYIISNKSGINEVISIRRFLV